LEKIPTEDGNNSWLVGTVGESEIEIWYAPVGWMYVGWLISVLSVMGAGIWGWWRHHAFCPILN
jgi:hypothetical protein